MIDDQDAVRMLLERLHHPDETLPATEAVLLRIAFEDIDDWLIWLEHHTLSTHGQDASTPAVVRIISAVRGKLASKLRHLDFALSQVEAPHAERPPIA